MAQKPPSAWETEKASRDKSQPTKNYSAAAVFKTLDNICAAVVAGKIDSASLSSCLAIMRIELDPAFHCEFGDDSTMGRCRASVRVWIAALRMASADDNADDDADLATEVEEAKTAVNVTATDFARAAAIAAGSVVELPTDPTARAIVAAAAKARNEKKEF